MIQKTLHSIVLWLGLLVMAQSGAHAQLFREEPLYTDLEIALKNPLQVKRLALTKEKFKRFPKEVFRFPNLIELDLSRNKIREIPPEIQQLKKLEVLLLERNDIEELPAFICEMPRLRHLDLRKNELFKIPDCLGKMYKLHRLILASNPIFRLPPDFEHMSQLEFLDLRSTDIHPEILKALGEALPATEFLWDSDCNCGPNH